MNTQNKTQEVKADWEKEFDKKFSVVDNILYYSGGVFRYLKFATDKDVKDFIKKNFVAKGEVREMIEDIQATEIADHSLASLIEKLHKYKKSLE